MIETFSATRNGSGRLTIGMPSARRRARLVWRASTAICSVHEDEMQDMVVWCSLTMIPRPISSAAIHSSI